jgi:type IV pilus assembly protein PilM
MALPFLKTEARKQRDRMIAVDLGTRTTKAVHLERRGETFALTNYALLDAPIFEKNLSPELLSEHLKAVTSALDPRTKLVTLTVSVNDAVVRHTEMPRMPIEDMRMVLKLNSKTYLQQDLANHLYDCHVLPPAQVPKGTEPAKPTAGPPKHRILVAGAKKQLVDDLLNASRAAGLVPDHVFPALVAPVNTLERAMADAFYKDVVAVIDLGFKSSSISILQQGDLALSRVVAIGGDKLTNSLAENLGISYAEAEGIKVGMADEVQNQLDVLITPLGRELRASIDFFEHQHDRHVSHAFILGGAARSDFILQKLKQELMIECTLLNPTNSLKLELPPQQTADLEQVAPQLGVALGAAFAAL